MAERAMYPAVIRNKAVLIEPGDTTTLQNLVTGDTNNGSRIHAISITADESVANAVIFSLNDGTEEAPIARVVVPIGAGTIADSPPVSALNSVDMPWLGDDLSLLIEADAILKVAAATTVETDDQITVVAWYTDY